MFQRKQSDVVPPAADLTEEPVPGLVGAGKGRPTPKRRAAEAANRRPLVPTDRKAAAKAAKVAARADRDRQYRAMQTGDERFLPLRDRGPVRRYIRDSVDARWSLGEFFLPIALVFVALTALFSQNLAVSGILMVLLYAIVLATILDAFLMWRRMRKRIAAKFGPESLERGMGMYAAMRVFQLRRGRMPKPQVKHGQHPV
ncbi:DUF3043 domain-containing protein [Cellulomonas aerilata]|uniref:DUF3043 domain-containing protein n=1 Tax=Cellulomonas aerilata TaxID=515326 RepID=UPI0011BD6990|nr:DUF3043 domain-containing protein [Cellulomonas aerilata]